jgi:D-lactate dehydrogenase
MGLIGKLAQASTACSEETSIPRGTGYRGFAGDPGFLFPELIASATTAEAFQVIQRECNAYVSGCITR